MNFSQRLEDTRQELNEKLVIFAQERPRTLLLDLANHVETDSVIDGDIDGIHLSEAGYRAFGDLIYGGLGRAFTELGSGDVPPR